MGRLVVVIFSGATMRIDAAALAVCGVGLESFAWIVKLNVPVVVGIPVIAPVEEFRLRPAGKNPEATLQAYGVTPPVAEATEA